MKRSRIAALGTRLWSRDMTRDETLFAETYRSANAVIVLPEEL